MALALFPKREGFLHDVLFSVQMSAFDCLTSEGALVGCEGYVHGVRVRESGCGSNRLSGYVTNRRFAYE